MIVGVARRFQGGFDWLRQAGVALGCTECAEPLVLQIALQEPRLAAFLAGLIGLAAGTGFSALCLVFVVVSLIIRARPGSPGAEFYIGTVPALIIEGLALTSWLRGRQKLRRYSWLTRAILVAGCWVLTLANVIGFSILVR